MVVTKNSNSRQGRSEKPSRKASILPPGNESNSGRVGFLDVPRRSVRESRSKRQYDELEEDSAPPKAPKQAKKAKKSSSSKSAAKASKQSTLKKQAKKQPKGPPTKEEIVLKWWNLFGKDRAASLHVRLFLFEVKPNKKHISFGKQPFTKQGLWF